MEILSERINWRMYTWVLEAEYLSETLHDQRQCNDTEMLRQKLLTVEKRNHSDGCGNGKVLCDTATIRDLFAGTHAGVNYRA